MVEGIIVLIKIKVDSNMRFIYWTKLKISLILKRKIKLN